MTERKKIVYVIQELPGTKANAPKINIMSAREYGEFKFLLPEFSQIIFSPGPLVFKLRKLLNKFNLLKWDRQERMYYPLKINLYEKGEINVD
jgi:hypothetical protein